MSGHNALAKKVFTEFVENMPLTQVSKNVDIRPEGIVSSVNDFVDLLVEANNKYNVAFQIPETKQIILAEDMPGDFVIRLNNNTSRTDISDDTAGDIKIVTYLATEQPAVISARKLGEDGIRTIKWRPEGVYPDPDFTGYSLVRRYKDIEATITFKVWGKYFKDIRERSKLLKNIIETSVWYFKSKGLRDIVWLGSFEEEVWDNKNVAKYKTEKYLIRFSEIQVMREKNIEQIVVQYGLS